MNAANNNPPAAQISVSEFAAKFNSKREVYRFLASDVKAYLPDVHTVTAWHLRDLAASKKMIVPSNNVRFLNVP